MITPIEAKDMPKRRRRKGSERLDAVVNDLHEFADGGYEVCEITNPGYKSAKNFYNMVLYAVKNNSFDMKPTMRGERVFVIRGGGDD